MVNDEVEVFIIFTTKLVVPVSFKCKHIKHGAVLARKRMG